MSDDSLPLSRSMDQGARFAAEARALHRKLDHLDARLAELEDAIRQLFVTVLELSMPNSDQEPTAIGVKPRRLN